jgi:peroxiredoxin
MQAFQANLQRLEAADTQVLGMSLDSPPANKEWAQKINVSFPLLSDWGGEVIKKYGIAKEYDMHGVKIIAARRVNYVIDKTGKVVEMQVDSDAVDPTKIVDVCERKKLKE